MRERRDSGTMKMEMKMEMEMKMKREGETRGTWHSSSRTGITCSGSC